MRKRRKTVISLILTGALVLCSMYSYSIRGYATTTDGNETGNATEGTADNTEGANSTDDANNNDSQTGNTDSGPSDVSVGQARQDAKEAAQNKKAAQEILDNLRAAKHNIEDYIIQLDKSLNELQIEISHLEQNQKELQGNIEETQKKLELAKGAQEDQYEDMKQRIQMVYESGNKGYLDVLLTATSMTDIINKTEYISQVSLYDYNMLKKLKDAKEQVANLKMKLDKDLESNQALQEEVNEQKATVEALVEEKTAQVAEYTRSIAGQEAEVSKYAQAQAEAEAIIAQAEQNASNSANSVYTGGIFTWPVPGYYGITSYFGGRSSPTAGASSNHKGIDIACDSGVSIVAASDGTVIVAAYNYAEGNYVCIDHGGGVVTLYMHNSALMVSVGDTVVAGQQIAAAGSTGISTGPHCHFGVRVDGNYVDPLAYLQ